MVDPKEPSFERKVALFEDFFRMKYREFHETPEDYAGVIDRMKEGEEPQIDDSENLTEYVTTYLDETNELVRKLSQMSQAYPDIIFEQENNVLKQRSRDAFEKADKLASTALDEMDDLDEDVYELAESLNRIDLYLDDIII